MVHVLHVDDDPSLGELTAEFLGRIHTDWTITTEAHASDGLSDLNGHIDCIVSDYDMPEINGLEFLKSVRETHPKLPFILFTGKGSEEVAAEAISAGVTDYLQKGGGTDRYQVLANRIRNVVARYRAEQEAKRGYDAMEAANDGIALLGVDGHISYVNRSFAEHYGYTQEKLQGRHWEFLHEDEEIERFYDEIIPRVESTGTWAGRTIGKRQDGSMVLEEHTITLSDAGTTICVLRDITDKQDGEQALTAKLDFLDDALDHLDDIFYIFEKDGTLLWWNDQLSKITGYSETELAEMAPASFVREQDRQQVSDHIDEATEMGHSQVEAELIKQDGTTVPYQFYSTELTQKDGSVIGRVGIGRNISVRKDYERRLQWQNERLNEFAGVLSHDLRNPLTVAMGQLSILAEELDGEYEERIEKIDGSLSRIQQIIEDVLALSKTEAAEVNTEPISLASLATKAWSNIEWGTTEISVEDVMVRADESLLERLLTNLLRNAIEHGGMDVSVRVGPLSDDSGFYVADNGPGIPESRREAVFRWEYSTKEGGTGIGLRSAQQICEAHGWEISIEDSEDGGARFEITGVETGP